MRTVTALLEPKKPERADFEAFLDRQAALLQLEREEEEEQTRLLNSNCSTKLLEQRGLALNGLGVSAQNVGLGGKTIIELHRPLAYHTTQALPPHTFRPGDPVRVEEYVSAPKKGKAGKEELPGVEGVVYKVGPEKVSVAVSEGDVDLPERLRIVKLANSVVFDRMRKTLDHLRRLVVPEEGASTPSADNMTLVNSLLGMQKPTWSKAVAAPTLQNAEAKDGSIEWIGERLNDSQKEAIDFCLRADSVACIHGPPGTGKTHTLVELILQFLARPVQSGGAVPPRILVTTPSNLALDNLLARLSHVARIDPKAGALLPPGSILRLGHPSRVSKDLLPATLDYKAVHGDAGALVADIGDEIKGHLSDLGKKRGERGAVKGKARGEKWGEVRELRREYRAREAKVVKTVVGEARVVLATCHSAGSRQINNVNFDVAVIDEATQALEPVAWVPILKAKKLVLAGDPQQLPPTITSKPDKLPKLKDDAKVEDKTKGLSLQPTLRPPRTLETTLFDRLEDLYGAGIKRVLKVQYRMNEKIAEFPSKTLYGGELISDPSVATHTLMDLPSVEADSEDAEEALSPPVIFYDTAGCDFRERDEEDELALAKRKEGEGGSKSNENEAEIVARVVRRLVSLGVPEEEVGVVVPYQAQVAVLAKMLREEFPNMTIGTVDGLQGQERDAVVLSLVRSNEKGDVGFLGQYKRLNVAMTRPRRQLVVVGDSETVAKGSAYLKSWIKWLEDNADVRYAGDEV